MRGRLGQLAIELRRPDLHAIEQGAALEMQRERDDADAASFDQLRGQVCGRVGDDRNTARAQDSAGSCGAGSVRRRFRRLRKTRSSSGLSAMSTMATRTVVNTAT